MSIALTYLHDIPVDSLIVKLFDGGTLVATVSMSADEDVDRECMWSGTLTDEPASTKLEWEAFENGGTQKVVWGDAIGFVDGATVRLDEDNSVTSDEGDAIANAIGVVDGIVDAIKAQTDKLDFSGTGSALKAEATNVGDLATKENVDDARDAVLQDISELNDFDPATQTVTVGTNNDKSGYSLDTAPPTAGENAEAVRAELETELGRIDVNVSSRLAPTTTGRTVNVNSSGHIERVVLVDTTTTNTDMRGTDGAITSLSGIATAIDVSNAQSAIQSDISGLNDLDSADVQLASAAALTAYDPPTRAESTADKNEILGAIPDVSGLVEKTDLPDNFEILSIDGDGNVSTEIDHDELANAVWELAGKIDGKSPQQALRYIAAVLAGEIPTGAGTSTETFYGLDGVTPRVRVTADESGNRTNVEYDP